MPNQAIAPIIIPNIGNQEAAVAGSSAAIFTATDRKLIEERTGEIDRSQTFREIFQNKPLSPKVENEETRIKSEPDVTELEGRYQDHRRMLKHSTLYTPQDLIEINEKLPDHYEEEKALKPEAQPSTIHNKTAALAKELKLDYLELVDKFSLEKNELFSLISHIKELHLKRLLCEDHTEFDTLTSRIKQDSLGSAKPEARAWVEAQMDKMTSEAAEYKIGILNSLQSMEFKSARNKTIKWLKQTHSSMRLRDNSHPL